MDIRKFGVYLSHLRKVYALLQSELCVHDISDVLDMGQSAVSHQLRYLRNLRVVKRRKVGKTVFYSLDDDHISWRRYFQEKTK